MKRFIHFHGKRNPKDLGAPEVATFLTLWRSTARSHLQPRIQAKSALLVLNRAKLGEQLPWLDEVVAAKCKRRLPVVLTPSEVRHLLQAMSGTRPV